MLQILFKFLPQNIVFGVWTILFWNFSFFCLVKDAGIENLSLFVDDDLRYKSVSNHDMIFVFNKNHVEKIYGIVLFGPVKKNVMKMTTWHPWITTFCSSSRLSCFNLTHQLTFMFRKYFLVQSFIVLRCLWCFLSHYY